MQRVILESSPAFIILCVLAGIGYASVIYVRNRRPWSNRVNTILFALRAIVVFAIAFLLLGPIVKQITNLYEKPLYIVLHDNSVSVKAATDSSTLQLTSREINAWGEAMEEKGFDVQQVDLEGNTYESSAFKEQSSDITGALRKIANRYEGRSVAGVVLLSDGIYNEGISPLYASYNFPIHTIGIGDTTQRTDAAIKNVAYNKIVYQGNKFPVQVQVLVKNMAQQSLTVSLLQRGKVIDKQTKNTGRDPLLFFDFQPLAGEQGIQKLDVQVEVKPGERNTRNNRTSIFVEVVEGRKKILVIAASPHPDLKALREVAEKNSNYEFLIHIPGVEEQQASVLRPDKIDLAVFHQAPDIKGKTRELFQQFAGSKTSLLLVLGQQTDLREVVKQKMPLKMDAFPRDYDEVTPLINASFSQFTISPETNSTIGDFPPVSVHFGKISIPPNATPLLYQRVGSIPTDKPLLAIDATESRKVAILLGDGIWRWRLNEFDKEESTTAFDELFGKLLQYLTTTDDKRKFKSYPVQQEFSDNDPVAFESQVYNDIYEPVYGNTIDIELTDEAGKKNRYTYVTSPGNIRYQIGGLKEGVYKYRSKTMVDQKQEEVRGEFAVVQEERELQNLTADFDLLRKLSENTGGNFYTASDLKGLSNNQTTQAKSVIHTEEFYDALINNKWLFWLLLILVSGEWMLRKYHGSY